MGCCAGAIVFAGAPRLALFVLWLVTDRLSIAFDSFWPGLAGFILLPYTTVLYVLAYAPGTGVSGIGWVLVVLGLLLDLGSYSSGAYSQRTASRSA
jgi:hypothetical protein